MDVLKFDQYKLNIGDCLRCGNKTLAGPLFAELDQKRRWTHCLSCKRSGISPAMRPFMEYSTVRATHTFSRAGWNYPHSAPHALFASVFDGLTVNGSTTSGTLLPTVAGLLQSRDIPRAKDLIPSLFAACVNSPAVRAADASMRHRVAKSLHHPDSYRHRDRGIVHVFPNSPAFRKRLGVNLALSASLLPHPDTRLMGVGRMGSTYSKIPQGNVCDVITFIAETWPGKENALLLYRATGSPSRACVLVVANDEGKDVVELLKDLYVYLYVPPQPTELVCTFKSIQDALRSPKMLDTLGGCAPHIVRSKLKVATTATTLKIRTLPRRG